MNCGLSGSELSNAVTSHSYASVARCRFHTSRNTVPIYTPANQHCANCIGTLSVTSTPPETLYLYTRQRTSTVPTVSAHSVSLPHLHEHRTYIHASEPALCQLYRHTHCHFHTSRNTVPIYTPANQHCANCIGTLTVASTPPETPYLQRQPTTRQQHID